MRAFCWVILVLSGMLVWAGCHGQESDVASASGDASPVSLSTTPPPHIVFISMDTCRADYLGCYGHPWIKTPCLDAFAREGILYEQCITVAPTTLTSHTSLFTGQYPHTHGVPRNGFRVNDANQMLPEFLREAGYFTAGFPSATPLFGSSNFNQGFDYYEDQYSTPEPRRERRAKVTTDAALAFVDRRDMAKPLFLFVHYFDVHAPYAPPPPFDRMYDDRLPAEIKKRPRWPGEEFGPVQRQRQAAFPHGARRPSFSFEDFRQDRQTREIGYACEVSYVDKHVGRLLEGLKARGILDRAVTVIVSDHGENLLDHAPNFEHGRTLFASTTRIVCMFRLPEGRLGGTRVPGLISSIDVLPTLLVQAGVMVPGDIAGHALVLERPLEGPFREYVYSEATKPHEWEPGDGSWFNLSKARAIRGNDYLLVNMPKQGRMSFFNWRVDAGETNDLMRGSVFDLKLTPVRETMRELLEKWAHEDAPLQTVNLRMDDEELDEQLDALGYLE